MKRGGSALFRTQIFPSFSSSSFLFFFLLLSGAPLSAADEGFATCVITKDAWISAAQPSATLNGSESVLAGDYLGKSAVYLFEVSPTCAGWLNAAAYGNVIVNASVFFFGGADLLLNAYLVNDSWTQNTTWLDQPSFWQPVPTDSSGTRDWRSLIQEYGHA